MITTTKLLSIIFITALAFTLHSCSKPCKDEPCVNGTCVEDGKNYTCTCETGYEGTVCDTEEREKFFGIFEGNESCTVSGSGSLTITISTSTTKITEVKITGSWSTFLNPIIADISGNNFTIASQDPDNNGKTISGSGSITNDQTMISVDYTVTDTGANVCSSTLTRK